MLTTFIKRPVLSLVISIVITLLGVLALFNLPITQFPDIVPPSVVVTADYTGANAEVVTDAVAIPLERAINGVAGMTSMNTVSTNNGITIITVTFKVGVDPDIAAVNVQNRVTTVLDELPEEVIKAGVRTEKEVNSMLMYLNLFTEDDSADERFIYNYVDINILRELKRIEGVGLVEIMGLRDYAMRVWLQPDRMSAYNLSVDEVVSAIRAQNVEAAPGQTGIGSDKLINMQQCVLKYPGKFTTEEEYRNIPIRANANGTILRLKDIAHIEFGSLDYEMSSKTDGRPSASIRMKQLPGSNAQEVIERVKESMENMSKRFPPGMTYTVSYDVSRFLDASIHEVIKTLIEAFLLVFIVMFIFLQDFRSTIIPVLAVPVSLVGALAVIFALGFSINLLTLFALVLAIGIVVDDAIVVVEAVHVKMHEDGLPPLEATIAAIKDIGGAIIAITLVMSAVFIPVAFLSGPVGIFYRQFSLTLAAAIIISGINALTLTPALCALMIKPIDHHQRKGWLGNFFAKFNYHFDKNAGSFTNYIAKIAGRRTLILGILLAFLLLTFGTARMVPSGFIPTEDQGMIYVSVTTPPGSTVDRTEKILLEIDSIARTHPSVETNSTLAGFNILSEVSGSSYGMAMVNLKSWDERKESIYDLIDFLKNNTKHLLDASIEFFPPPTVPGFGSSSGFELRFLDKTATDDVKNMDLVLKSFLDSVKASPVIKSLFSSFDPNFPQYMLHVDYDMAAKKGVNVENAMNTLQMLVGSYYATNFIRYGQMYKLMVQASPEYRQRPEDILKLQVRNNAGEMVPLSAIMHMEKIYGPEQITRYNMYTAAMLTGEPNEGYSTGDAIKVIETVAKNHLPSGYEIEWSGITREEILSGNQALFIFMLCLVFVYLILAAQYESFAKPLAVILSLPAGLFGAFLFLWITGMENNIYAQVAMVMLIGLLGKNAILIVEFAMLKEKEGLTPYQAAIEGTQARLRPILMTSFAFIAGLVPLALASGAGEMGNKSIGITAIGGMLIGTIFGTILVPGLYVLCSQPSKLQPMKKGASTVVILAVILMFTACKTNSHLPVLDKQPLPEAYLVNVKTQEIDTNRFQSWKDYFADAKLIALIEKGLKNNLDMKMAHARVQAAASMFKQRKMIQTPVIDAVANAGLRKYGHYTQEGIGNYDTNFSGNLSEDEKLPDPLPDYMIGLQARWEIDLWGKLLNKKKAAFYRFLSTVNGQQLLQTQLVANICDRYYKLQTLDAQHSIIKQNLLVQQQALELILVQKDAGRANELGVQQFVAMVKNSKAAAHVLEQEMKATRFELNTLIGQTHAEIEQAAFRDNIFVDIEGLPLPVYLLSHRPDIRQAFNDLQAQKHELKSAQAELLPSLVLSPFIGLQAFNINKLTSLPQSMTYGLLGGLSAPLFNQNQLRSQLAMQKALYGESFYKYEQTVLMAWQEANTLISGLQLYNQAVQMKYEEVHALRTAYDAAMDLFSAGRANYLEVINVQKNLLEAEINHLEMNYQRMQMRIQLYKAFGGGWTVQ